ncbi:hypothetical protein CC86DRAFT_466502 [Ophiobolus disseminans]|uniref:Uncharacterized protein n=1 Tax=Ophiobolus disseminans TaxID=1469910 RepID=A0A6A7A0N0_9PLEO|nr:hypothetical protein CC86DRAFT_466502 [Ophiobolus disseminans]
MTTDRTDSREDLDDDHQQDCDETEDIEMPDAPTTEPTPRRPRKLDNRSSGVPLRDKKPNIHEMEEQVIQLARTYSGANTHCPNCKATVTHTQSSSSSHETHRASISVAVTTERHIKSGPEKDKVSEARSRQAGRSSPRSDPHVASTSQYRSLPEIPAGDEWAPSKEEYEGVEQKLINTQNLLSALRHREGLWNTAETNWLAAQQTWTAEMNSWKAKEENWKAEANRSREREEDQQTKLTALEAERTKSDVNKKMWEGKEKQLEDDLKNIRILWKRTAKELNGVRTQGQGFYQITDNYLQGLITQLRYNIRSFAIQYFSGTRPKRITFEPNRVWRTCMEPITDGSEAYLDYMISPDQRTGIVQGFLWRILFHEVFNNFRWAGASRSMVDMYETLRYRPVSSPMSSADVEAIKKFHIWRATTVGLLLDSMDEEKRRQAASYADEWKQSLFRAVDVNLRVLQSPYKEDYKHNFMDIVDEALKLDREISRQVSYVEWIFNDRATARAFQPEAMELENGKRPSKNESDVGFVISPGVTKRGKSSGEGYEASMWLLKMEVTCEAPKLS